jgi:four helix bundle protein
MEISKSFFNLWTWKTAHQLTLEIYKLTRNFPAEEKYCLVSQMRSAASSVPINIAEGTGRGTARDFIRFLIQARGSVQEVVYQIYLAKSLGYISEAEYCFLDDQYNRLGAAINNQIKSLQP